MAKNFGDFKTLVSAIFRCACSENSMHTVHVQIHQQDAQRSAAAFRRRDCPPESSCLAPAPELPSLERRYVANSAGVWWYGACSKQSYNSLSVYIIKGVMFVCLSVCIYVPYDRPNGWADRDQT